VTGTSIENDTGPPGFVYLVGADCWSQWCALKQDQDGPGVYTGVYTIYRFDPPPLLLDRVQDHVVQRG
jgi:hypothetical protein